jgi:hypothetical protein
MLGYYWGISGVLLILLSAIVRLSVRVFEMYSSPLSVLQWLLLVIFSLYMAYAEGYKGFHLNFAPRVISRAQIFLVENNLNNFIYIVFAPLLCMGYIYSTKKRKVVSFLLTGAIIILVLLVRLLPQPWRGIIDAGVVLGLCLGTTSIVYFWFKSIQKGWVSPVPADFPDKEIPNKNVEAV